MCFVRNPYVSRISFLNPSRYSNTTFGQFNRKSLKCIVGNSNKLIPLWLASQTYATKFINKYRSFGYETNDQEAPS